MSNHSKLTLTVLALLTSALSVAEDLSTYEARREWLLRSQQSAELTKSGWFDLPKACARLWNNPKDPKAVQYITYILRHKSQTLFDFPGLALALGMFRNSFTPAQVDTIRTDLEKLALTARSPGKEGFMGHGTENHDLAMWCSAYLFAQWFPEARWCNGMTSEQLMAEMRKRIRIRFRRDYEMGYTEYLSTQYDVTVNVAVTLLYKFAQDAEVKAYARAYLLYKWSLLALNNFEGHVIAPYGRQNCQEDTEPKDLPAVAGTAYYNWLLWGWGPSTAKVSAEHFRMGGTQWTISTALLDVKPDEIFFTIARPPSVPFQALSSVPTFGTLEDGDTGVPHMMMRKIYRDRLFAIGTGNFRWVPGGHYADHDTVSFNIVWHTADRFRYLECDHPYWYSDGDDPVRNPDAWAKGSISPFQQTAHDKNTAIVLFNIPDRDPWPGKPTPEKWAWRDGHAENLIKRGQFRFPKSMDEVVERGGWIFLREGEVYIGVKSLKSYYIQRDLADHYMEGFNVVKSDWAQCGFVFEVGTQGDFGTFSAFQDKLLGNKLTVSWEKMQVAYTNSQGDTVKIQYRPGLEVAEDASLPRKWIDKGITGLAESVPVVTVNGRSEMSYRRWPVIDSKFVTLNGGVLKVSDGGRRITVDWSGDKPEIKSVGF